MAFDPKRHIIKLKGKDYLPIAARLVWFRDDHPDWGIVTTPVEINMEKQYAIFSASIFNGDGKLMATATKMENIGGFGDFIEKAETGSVGRALAYCGYGTQFAPELEEGGRFADAPYGGGGNFNTANRFQQSGNGPRPNGNNYNGGNGNGSNNSYGNNAPRPANNGNTAAPPPRPAPMPAPPAAPRPDDDFGDPGYEEPQAAPVRAAAQTPAPAPSPAKSEGVMRVREPERDFGDPGGTDEDDEDPFFEEDDAPALTASAQPAALAPDNHDDEDDGGPIVPRTGNRCAAEGCEAKMPPAMVAMTAAKFGKPLCPVHQKGATPLIGGSVSVGTSARPRAKAGAASGGGDGGLL